MLVTDAKPVTMRLLCPGLQVAFADAATYTAKVVGWDAAKDIAVLRLSMPKQKVMCLLQLNCTPELHLPVDWDAVSQ